jgi:Uma2 family endonuclease
MSATSVSPPAVPGEEQVVLRGLSWDLYERVNDAAGEGRNPRMIFCDGSLTIVVAPRRHDWYAERLGQLVVALAEGLKLLWEDAGQATFRRKEMNACLEGDKTFYLCAHAQLMKGPGNIDLSVQPPPDLAIEVEVSHTAEAAMAAWGRLGVAEVWRFDPVADEFSFSARQVDGRYAFSDRSLAFPALRATDVLEQMRRASELGASEWDIQLRNWVRDAMPSRLDGEAEN